mgnify:FL=1
MVKPDPEEWAQQRALIEHQLADHAAHLQRIDDRWIVNERELAVLGMKAGVWGLMGALLPVIAAGLWATLKFGGE